MPCENSSRRIWYPRFLSLRSYRSFSRKCILPLGLFLDPASRALNWLLAELGAFWPGHGLFAPVHDYPSGPARMIGTV